MQAQKMTRIEWARAFHSASQLLEKINAAGLPRHTERLSDVRDALDDSRNVDPKFAAFCLRAVAADMREVLAANRADIQQILEEMATLAAWFEIFDGADTPERSD